MTKSKVRGHEERANQNEGVRMGTYNLVIKLRNKNVGRDVFYLACQNSSLQL